MILAVERTVIDYSQVTNTMEGSKHSMSKQNPDQNKVEARSLERKSKNRETI